MTKLDDATQSYSPLQHSLQSRAHKLTVTTLFHPQNANMEGNKYITSPSHPSLHPTDKATLDPSCPAQATRSSPSSPSTSQRYSLSTRGLLRVHRPIVRRVATLSIALWPRPQSRAVTRPACMGGGTLGRAAAGVEGEGALAGYHRRGIRGRRLRWGVRLRVVRV